MSDQETPDPIAARIAEAGKRAKAEAQARHDREQAKAQLPPELG